jgi:hypothetical protein
VGARGSAFEQHDKTSQTPIANLPAFIFWNSFGGLFDGEAGHKLNNVRHQFTKIKKGYRQPSSPFSIF